MELPWQNMSQKLACFAKHKKYKMLIIPWNKMFLHLRSRNFRKMHNLAVSEFRGCVLWGLAFPVLPVTSNCDNTKQK